jgi:superfamily II DNA or RNA helicase
MDTFVKKVPRSSATQEPKTKKIVIKKITKKVIPGNEKSIVKVGGEPINTEKDTVLGTKGYSINKSDLTEEEIIKLKDELMAKPHTQGGFSVSTIVKKFPIYRESTTRLYMPRYFGDSKFGIAKRMKVPEGVAITVPFQGSLRTNQVPVVETYLNHVRQDKLFGSGGLLELPCAYGKTTLSLYICSELKVKTLVIVHKEFLLNQWVERIREFLPTARVGRIQGTTIDIENKDIVIGMLQSLSMKDYPDGTFSSFGLTIIDEVHHISSEVFSCALFKIVTKYMLGLSATMNRKDGTTKVFKMFLGDVVYKGDRDQEHDVIVRGIQYRSDDDDFNSIVTNFRGDIIYSTMISKLCGYNKRSEFILRVLSDMLKENNEQQIMILAHNKSLLTYLYDAIDTRKIASVGYYVGGMKEAALKESETKKVVIATYSMASEALDIKTLTTLIMATPKTDIEQSIGRILRQRHTNPIVVDIIDQHEPFIRQWYKRRNFYKKHNYQIIQTTSTSYTPDTTQWKSTKTTPTKKASKKTTINTQETVLQQLLNNSGVVEDCGYTQGNDSDNDSGDELFQDPDESRKNTGSKCLI